MPIVVPGLVKSSSDTVGDCDSLTSVASSSRLAYFGQAKIQNFRLAAGRHENVCRLDVAMHDALGVGRVQRIGDFLRHLRNCSRWQQHFR